MCMYVCVRSFEMQRAEGHLNSNYSVPEQVYFARYDNQINYLINTYTLRALCKNKTRIEIKATSLDRIVSVLHQNTRMKGNLLYINGVIVYCIVYKKSLKLN